MKIIKDFNQGESAWHSWRAGKITSTGVSALVGYVAKTKEDFIVDAKKHKISLPTKIINAGKKNERIDVSASVDEIKDILIANDKYVPKKFEAKGNLDDMENYPKMIWDMIAHRLSDGTAPTDENPMQRGHRLEPVTRDFINEKYGKNYVEVGGIESSLRAEIAMSPDGVELVTSKDKEYVIDALEVKALNGGDHVKAYFLNRMPEKFFPQALQYFIVNTMQKQLMFVMSCPEIKEFPYLEFIIKREDIEDEIAITMAEELEALYIVDKLTDQVIYG